MSKRKQEGTNQRSILGVKQTQAILIMALTVLSLAPRGTWLTLKMQGMISMLTLGCYGQDL